MDRLERFYRIHHLMKAGRCVPLSDLLSEFEVSRATLKRDLEYMRERLNAPLIYDRDREGYRYDTEIAGADRYDLPGVWFSPPEIHALVVVHSVLSEIGPGLLDGTVAPLLTRIEKLLENHRLPATEVRRRIRVLNVGHRTSLPTHFGMAAQAVLQRQCLRIHHCHRGEERLSIRTVSPQRLIYYRGTWYLDTWCHTRKALRSFSLDAIQQMSLTHDDLCEVPESDLQDFFGASYGIFTGTATQTAVLRFSAGRARWARHERWHPAQVGRDEPDGSYRLEFPYGNDTELVMDILRHGAEVEVLQPESLRQVLSAQTAAAAALYSQTP